MNLLTGPIGRRPLLMSGMVTQSLINPQDVPPKGFDQYFRPDSVSPLPTQSVVADAAWFERGINPFPTQANIRTLDRPYGNNERLAVATRPVEQTLQVVRFILNTSYGKATKPIEFEFAITDPAQLVTPWHVLTKYSQQIRHLDIRGSHYGGLLTEVNGIRNWYLSADPQRPTKFRNSYCWFLFAGPSKLIYKNGKRVKSRDTTVKDIQTRGFYLWKGRPGFIQTDLTDQPAAVDPKALIPSLQQQVVEELERIGSVPQTLVIAYDDVSKYTGLR